MFQNKFRLMLVGLLVLGLAVSNIFAQFVPDGKTIAEMARKANYDNSFSAQGVGIKGKFTPTKESLEEKSNFSNGLFLGNLELEVNNKEYDRVRSGKFNLFLRSEKEGLRLYLEEKEKIAAVLEVFEETPETNTKSKTNDKSLLAFPLPEVTKKSFFNLSGFQSSSIFNFSANSSIAVNCKIYIKVLVGGHWKNVWSGVTRRCGGRAS